MFKAKLNYNLKVGALVGLTTLATIFNVCKKDLIDPALPVDPNKEKIEALIADNTRLAGEVRAAVIPATKQPDDISDFY